VAQVAYQTPKTVSGTVEAVNPKGVKLNGEWANFSRFAEGINPPDRGQFVTLTLDKSGFVRSVEADGPPPAQQQPAPSGQRDRVIVRQSSIKTAFSFAESRPDMKAADAIKLAAIIEAWVMREDAE
jgi:hypothetical protein